MGSIISSTIENEEVCIDDEEDLVEEVERQLLLEMQLMLLDKSIDLLLLLYWLL